MKKPKYRFRPDLQKLLISTVGSESSPNDIAKAAGLSQPTVSAALTGKMTPKTFEMIMSACSPSSPAPAQKPIASPDLPDIDLLKRIKYDTLVERIASRVESRLVARLPAIFSAAAASLSKRDAEVIQRTIDATLEAAGPLQPVEVRAVRPQARPPAWHPLAPGWEDADEFLRLDSGRTKAGPSGRPWTEGYRKRVAVLLSALKRRFPEGADSVTENGIRAAFAAAFSGGHKPSATVDIAIIKSFFRWRSESKGSPDPTAWATVEEMSSLTLASGWALADLYLKAGSDNGKMTRNGAPHRSATPWGPSYRKEKTRAIAFIKKLFPEGLATATKEALQSTFMDMGPRLSNRSLSHYALHFHSFFEWAEAAHGMPNPMAGWGSQTQVVQFVRSRGLDRAEQRNPAPAGA